jgi:FkbM family methyltransferase
MTLQKYFYYLGSIPRLLLGIKPWTRVAAVYLGAAGPGPHRIELRGSGACFQTRGAMDIWAIKETWLDRFYERYGAAVQPGWTVVDIGGGLGDYSLFAALQQPTCQVYTFEPTPDSFRLLQENIAMCGSRNVRAEPVAIWSKAGEIAIDTSPGEAVQFISRETNGLTAPGQVRVASITLAQALERCGIERCDLLKMDCEGAEYPILFATPPETLQKVQRIVMEYHDNAGPYTHADLERFLSQLGYRVRSYPNAVHAYLGYLYAERTEPNS